MDNPTFKEPSVAFQNAISQGRLSIAIMSQYLYMGTKNGVDVFQRADNGNALDNFQPARLYQYGWPYPHRYL